MSKSIVMFVWNHFTNDARVMRSITALADAGYRVKLVAIQSFGERLQSSEQLLPNAEVRRVENQLLIGTLGTIFKLMLLSLVMSIILTLLVTRPLIGVTFLLLAILTYKKRKWGRIGYVFSQMIYIGLTSSCKWVHSNDLNTLLQGVIVKKVKGAILVYDSHEIQTSRTGYNSPWYGRIEKWLLRYVDIFIHENDTRAKYIQALYGQRPNVIHNYPTFKQSLKPKVDLRAQLAIPFDIPILLYQGGIQMGRGLDKLIEAVPLIEKGTVVLIGDGRLKPDLEKLVKEKGVSDRVKFLSKVPLANLHDYTLNGYIGFQLLNNVCFNHYSASSNKMFEYMMAGIPVIACDFPEMKKVITEWQTGVLVDSHSPVKIALAVNQLVSDEKLYKQLQANSLKARQQFNWEQEKELLLTIYEESQQNKSLVD